MGYYNDWYLRGYFLFIWFLVIYYIVFFLWAVFLLAMIIYVFMDGPEDKGLPTLVQDYQLLMSNNTFIVGFFIPFIISAVRNNIQAKIIQFESVMKDILVFIPEISIISESLPAEGPISRAKIQVLVYHLIDVILEAEDMDELCSDHHKGSSEYINLRRVPVHGHVLVKDPMNRVFISLTALKKALTEAAAYTTTAQSARAVITTSEMRAVFLRKILDKLDRLDEKYVQIDKHPQAWPFNQALHFLEGYIQWVFYVYLVLKPIELVTMAIPRVGDLFIAAAWYALITVLLLGVIIINSWYEMIYNGTAITPVDKFLQIFVTPVPSYTTDDVSDRTSVNRNAWKRYSRRLVLAADLSDSVVAATRGLLSESSSYNIQNI